MELKADMTVRSLIERCPGAIQFFLRRSMLCVGCPVEAFHTLEEVARIHGEAPDFFMNELGSSIATEAALTIESMNPLPEACEKGDNGMLKKVEAFKENGFSDKGLSKLLVHDSPYMKTLNFNFRAGQELPVHSHDIDGQLCIVVLTGSGLFLGKDDATIPAEPGDVLISDIAEPHGIRAATDMRVLVTIAPPI